MGPLAWKWEDEEGDGEGVGPWWVDDGRVCCMFG
jgi:hypothetical protein